MATATLPACSNTVHGAGEDIENAGEGVQKAVPPKS
jgi:predicted small secreted protein